MKNKITQILAVFTALLICVFSVHISVGAVTATVTASGECGDNLSWTLYDDDELIISGTGDMWNWTLDFGAPWESHSMRIKYVTIKDGVTSIGDYAFYECNFLKSVTIPASVTSIGTSAFANCIRLTSVTIPSSVTSIGSQAFYSCSNLTSVIISEGITSIGTNAFSHCTGLTSVTIPSSVTSIGEWVFAYCGLTSVIISEGITSIGTSAFANCIRLTSVTIPSSVTSIGEYAFHHCNNLTSVTIPEGVTSIGKSAFSSCSTLTSITIPSSVTSIGNYTFNGCTHLTSVTIPLSVTIIGGMAFADCGLKSVTYCGTEAQWGAVSKSLSWDENTGDYTLQYHSYDDGVITTDPTYESEGVKTYTCTACGATKTESIPKLEAPQEPDGRIYVKNSKGKAGQNVTVDFYLETEKDVRMLSVYDIVYSEDVMELVSLEWAVANSTFTDFSDGIATVLMGENTNISGKLFTVTFKIKDGAADGVYGVSFANAVKYSVTGQADVALNVTSEKGGIEVYSIDPGDANGDEVVNADDAVLLLKSIMLPDRYEVLCEPDINADGVFNADDVVYLLKHIMLPDRYPL